MSDTPPSESKEPTATSSLGLDAPPSADAKRRTVRSLLLRLAVSLGIGGLFLVFLRRSGLDLAPSASDFAHVKWWTVAAYFVLYTVVHYFRAIRWAHLLKPIAVVPTRRLIAISFVGFLAIMLLPLRMGEVVRPVLIREKGKISGSAALGTIAAERVLDGLYVALLLAIALTFVPRLPLDGVMLGTFAVANVPRLGYLLVLGFAGALATLAMFLWQRALAVKLTRSIIGLVSKSLAEKLESKVSDLADGLRAVPDPKLMLPFTIETLLYWGANALTMWLLGWGCGLPMSVGHAFSVMGVLAMGILLPSAPGLFGAFQFSVFAALLMYFPREIVVQQGAAYVFLMYVCQLAFHLVAGIVPIFTEKLSVMDALARGEKRS
ncbi:MAG: flippase-like domain-containing protein [Myxococcales bacterium]|nr:flippase-like domain-containing protein [Myxococcales bacterium]